MKVVGQSLYLQMDLESLLEHQITMQVMVLVIIEVMYVFITIPLQAQLHGHS